MTQLSQGEVLGRYELVLPVARGGMAEVWAARLHGSRGFKKLVALKTILPHAIDSERMEQMFLAEAELAARIVHPNVVHTLELGEHDGTLYLALEWVDGESLSALLSQAAPHGGVPLAIAVNIIGQACKGLHAAHELTDEAGNLLGVVHRDISPQNILVTCSGTVKVVDFGIAKATQCACTLTEAGELKGKLAYMAPEQLSDAQNVDRRADIFSMGTLLYAVTTGRHPFRGDHPSVTLKNITNQVSVPPPSSQVEDYPPALEEVVLKALKKDPEHRFATALDMLQALERALPEALERSFDVKVSEFVTLVAGTGAHRRQHRIKEAGERLDRLRGALGLEATSPSSLSALAIDGLEASGHAALSPASGTGLSAGNSKKQPSKLWLMGAGAVALGGVLGLGLAERGSEPSAGHAASGRPLAAGSSSPLTADPLPRKTAPPPRPSASFSESVAERPKLRERAVVRGATRPAASRPTDKTAIQRQPAVALRSAVAAPAPSAPVLEPSPKPQASPAAVPSPRSDAWDPNAFGARQ